MKTNKESWEIEFDKEFMSYGKSYPEGSDRSEVLSISELKAFIAKVREQAIRDTLERVKKENGIKLKQAFEDGRKEERAYLFDLANGLSLEPDNLKKQIEEFEMFLKQLDRPIIKNELLGGEK